VDRIVSGQHSAINQATEENEDLDQEYIASLDEPTHKSYCEFAQSARGKGKDITPALQKKADTIIMQNKQQVQQVQQAQQAQQVQQVQQQKKSEVTPVSKKSEQQAIADADNAVANVTPAKGKMPLVPRRKRRRRYYHDSDDESDSSTLASKDDDYEAMELHNIDFSSPIDKFHSQQMSLQFQLTEFAQFINNKGWTLYEKHKLMLTMNSLMKTEKTMKNTPQLSQLLQELKEQQQFFTEQLALADSAIALLVPLIAGIQKTADNEKAKQEAAAIEQKNNETIQATNEIMETIAKNRDSI